MIPGPTPAAAAAAAAAVSDVGLGEPVAAAAAPWPASASQNHQFAKDLPSAAFLTGVFDDYDLMSSGSESEPGLAG